MSKVSQTCGRECREICKTALLLLLIFATSICSSAVNPVSAVSQAGRALGGAAIVGVYKGIKASNNASKKPQTDYYGIGRSVASDYNRPYVQPKLKPEDAVQNDSIISKLVSAIKMPTPEELERQRVNKVVKKLTGDYNRACARMDEGIAVTDTLFWTKQVCRAIEYDLDSMATGCLQRLVLLKPSIEMLDSACAYLNYNAPSCAVALIDIYQLDYFEKFVNHYINPDSAEVAVADYGKLAKLAGKYSECVYKSFLTRAAICYFNNDYDCAATHLLYASQAEINYNYIGLPADCKSVLYNITLDFLFKAGRYSDMLTLAGECEKKYEDNAELLDRFVRKNPGAAFMLFEASLFVRDSEKATCYGEMAINTDSQFFESEYEKLYFAVYDDFLNNPSMLENLDFLVSPDIDKADAINNYRCIMADLFEKLPEGPDDIDEAMHSYYDEYYAPYREAILEIAKRLDILYDRQFSPDNAMVQLLAELVRTAFLSSTEQGNNNIKAVYERVVSRCDESGYQLVYLVTASNYALYHSLIQPKDAVKVVDKMLPVLKAYSKLEDRLYTDDDISDFYRYAAYVYSKAGKQKRVKEMEKLAANFSSADKQVD